MKAVTFHGRRDVRVDEVPDPTIEQPTDAVVRVTSTGICGSDLHLYEVMAPFLDEGDVLGHEPMGIVEATGADVTDIEPGDRVVIPFNISCLGQLRQLANGKHPSMQWNQESAAHQSAHLAVAKPNLKQLLE